MRILSFDQSVTATAVVILEEVSPAKFRIMFQEVYEPKGNGILRMMSIRSWMRKIFQLYSYDMVVRELHNQRQFGAAGQIQVVGGHIDALAYEYDFLKDGMYCMIPVSMWKKFCLGKGNLKKDTAYMMHVNKFIQKTPYLQVENEFQVLDDNIGDAICIGVCAAICQRILLDKPAHISDSAKHAILKKSLPTIFDYGKPG